MMETKVKGRIHSFQSLGTVDGPGIRFVVFTSGCNLRCGCCHNPDTWDKDGGKDYTAEEILGRVLRYREYYGEDGGITVSGGEPLLQANFVKELFLLCKQAGINTCLDTSGSILNPSVTSLLESCDRVLLDIKYTSDEDYQKYAGCSMDGPLRFLALLDEMAIPTTLRCVIIPTLNDTEESVLRLKEIGRKHKCVTKICQVKYDKMGLSFPFGHLPEPTREKMAALEGLIINH